MKIENSGILCDLLIDNTARIDTRNQKSSKSDCLNAIVISRMLARIYLSWLFDIRSRVYKARCSVERAEKEGVYFLPSRALLKKLRDEKESVEECVIRQAEITICLFDYWKSCGATFEDFCNLCNRKPDEIRADLLQAEDAEDFVKLAFVYNIDYRDTGSGYIENEVDAPFTHMFKEYFMHQITCTQEGKEAAREAFNTAFPDLLENTMTVRLGDDGQAHLFDRDGEDMGVVK